MERVSDRRRVVLVALGIAFAMAWSTAALQLPTTRVRPFVVAIQLERSPGAATLFPVARFTGSEWVNTWPGPVDGRTAAPSLSQIPEAWLGGPVPLEWTLWSPAGDRTRVTVTGTERGRDGCETSVKLVIAGAPPPPRDPWAADSTRVAIAGDARPEWIRPVAATDPAMPTLARVIHEAQRDNERLIGGSAIAEWTNGLAALDRAGVTAQVDVLVQSSAAGSVVYYFEASRRLPRSAGPRFMLYVRGWIRASADGTLTARDIARGAFLGEGGSNLLPIAAFHVGPRVMWLSRLSGYESLSFVLDDITSAAPRRLVNAISDGC
jgi:hypothetical protein